MARTLTLGNGNLLIGLDRSGQLRDFYFPYAGHANHVSGASGSYTHRLGVWVDGVLTWIDAPEWRIEFRSPHDDRSGNFTAEHDGLGIALLITDVVHNEENIYLRHIRIRNTRKEERTVKLFFGQEFRISESRRGDTAFYDPRVQSIVHYKGHNAFLIHALHDGKGFDDYSVGLFDIEGRLGSFADAEDGVLSKNPVEHGSVDSVIGTYLTLGGGLETSVYYWIAAASSVRAAHSLHTHVLTETPERLMASAERYWTAWTDSVDDGFTMIDRNIRALYRHSLRVIRAHTDTRGGIIASSDTDILNQGRDTYSYVWPRDSAYAAIALSSAGFSDVAERYFTFMAKCLEPSGYLMHKYRVDGALGSSWHPWVRDGVMELPIQEDETASVLFALGKHYDETHNLEFIESLFNPFVEPVAEFLTSYIHPETHLPLESYDLWEEKFGTSTYTTATVCGALQTASEFSLLLGKRAQARKYHGARERIVAALLTHLYDPSSGLFAKHVTHNEKGIDRIDRTIDMSSLHGLTTYGVLAPHDVRLKKALELMYPRLKVSGDIGGYMRYEGDNYYRTSPHASPNPWCITTLWVAQQYIRAARSRDDLRSAYELMEWIELHASKSGMFPEQLDPHTGAHLSTTPLVWSHAEFVLTVLEYVKKYRALTS